MYERLLAEHPEAPNLADATLQLARARAELGQFDAAREAFQGVVARHPDSAAAASARWEVAWLEYRAGRLRDAALAFRQLSTTVGSARLAGLYWAGRSLDQLGEKGAALALYREVLSRGPHGYYGILAARRVREKPPPPVALPVKLTGDPVGLLRPEARYQRAQALGSIGFDGFAILELEALGRDAAADSDRAWALGVAFADLGEAGRSLRYLRRALGSGRGSGGAGAAVAPLAALLSPRVRRARPRRGPHGGARPVRRRGRDPRGVLLRPPRALRRRGGRPDAAHARHRAPGRARARPPPRGDRPPCGSRP